MEQLTTPSPPAAPPAPSTRRMWRNYICGWAVYMLLVVLVMQQDDMREHGYSWSDLVQVLWIIPQALCLALLWPLTGWMERRQVSTARATLIHATGAPLFAVVYFAVPAVVYGLTKSWQHYLWPILYAVMGYAIIATMFHMIRANDVRRRQALAIQQAHALLVATELNALRSKLNPHFLFNTLHSIIALTRKDADAAETALFQFSDMLRYVLDTDKAGNARVTLDEELGFVRDYLELEALRLGPRLHVAWELDDGAGGFALPPLSLQPLVENSIKHAFSQHSRPGRLLIHTRVDAARRIVTLSVRDDGPGADPDLVRASNGLGIRTVERRLQLEYGSGLAIETAPGAGFAVTMAIPLVPADEARP